ncbi:sialidase family protein [Streptomyces sp. SP18ES09]|uniref:sialidase family protein n=1 Tax=Streptomyces sp. SP18ES09 TaxID=3002532 RepID=UPI002E76A5C7|nr:sialidase family protein [Streptomyces sp. SP18ES09]MEE1815790.1 sialidase family protein [Streptomyces sp. SP18ES09]
MTVKSLGLLLLLVCAGLCFAQRGARDPAGASGPPAAPGGCQGSVPYAAGAGGYATYRIPAVVRTRAGTVLAFAEGRRAGAGDTGAIDVVVRRSADGGCTWGPLTVAAEGRGDTRGNPAPVVDPRSGDVVLLSSYNGAEATERRILRGEVPPARGRRVFVQRSSDDGRTFSAPEEITARVKRPGWRWYATGPGHALALTRGPHAGRLVVPADHSAAPPPGSPDTGEEPRYYGAHALLSDDGGRSWSLGFVDDAYEGFVNANETSAAQLPDGSLYFSARDQLGTSPGHRADATSGDGGRSLDRPFAPQRTLDRVPVVHGGLLHLGGRDGLLLFSAPSVPTAREEEALWSSRDGGRSYTKALTVDGRKAGYSDLVRLDGETVGLLYETGTRSPYETVEFRRIPLRTLTGTAP